MPFDSLTLAAVIGELHRVIIGAHVQAVRQVGPLAVMLLVRSRGRTHALLLSCETDGARLHLADRRAWQYEPAGTFTMALRKYVEGGVISSVSQVGFDRIAELRVHVHGTERRIVLEAMGRHSNLILVDADDTILGCAKQVGPAMSRVRPLQPGRVYTAPPAPSGYVDPCSHEASEIVATCMEQEPGSLTAWLRATFIGMSPFLAREIVSRTRHDSLAAVWRDLFGRASSCDWQPTVIIGNEDQPVGAYPVPLVSVPEPQQRQASSVNEALDEAYRALARSSGLDQRRQRAAAEITGALGARSARADDARERLAAASRADTLGQWGDLLLTLYPEQDRSSGYVEAPDLYGDGGLVRIPVDPTRSLAENAEEYYRKSRRLRSAAQWARAQLEALEAELDALGQAHEAVMQAQDAPAIDRLMEDLEARGLIRRSRSRQVGQSPASAPSTALDKGIRRVEGPDGWEMLVGLSAEGNDRLVRSHCAPHDFWFHVRSHTSAHVVVRNPERRPDLPRHVAEAAAMLAARNSKAKHSNYVTVDYTLGKYVRRPRGAAHGRVLYTHERTIHVDPTDRAQ